MTPGTEHDDERAARPRFSSAEAEIEHLRDQALAIESLMTTVGDQIGRLAALEARLEQVEAERRALEASRALRWARRVRRVLGARRPLVLAPSGPAQAPARWPSEEEVRDPRYASWIELYDTLDDRAREKIRTALGALAEPPLVSVILPVFDTPENYLREAVASVQAQIYENWELCIADDCSQAPWVQPVLAELAGADPRLKVVRRERNGHISAASNTALSVARGTWVALFDHDDVLPPHALAVAVLALAQNPGAGALYSDEDHIDDEGERSEPYFKPDFDPILLLGQNMFSHLCMLRRDLVEDVGGFREGYEGSQDWDLVLRVTERLTPAQVVHVPHVLYHWRVHPGSTASSHTSKPYAADAARRAVADHVGRLGMAAEVTTAGASSFTRVTWQLPTPPPLVSVVVVARDGRQSIRCLDSVRARSTYPSVELVVVDDGGYHPPLRQWTDGQGPAITVVRDPRDVTDGALRNSGVRAARGEVVCFLHHDVEVLSERWLEEMVGLLLQPRIGAVGAKLLYPEGFVQSAGMVLGIGGTVGHSQRRTHWLAPGYFGRAMLAQSYSAVSWAAMAVRREAFDDVGGFAEDRLGPAFCDVDFCLRLGEAAWRVAWTPHAELYHHEPMDEPRETDGENTVRLAREIRYLQTRWGDLLGRDPAYNPNLTLAHENFALAWPPRVAFFGPGTLPEVTGPAGSHHSAAGARTAGGESP